MSRIEENENMIQAAKRVFNGKPDDVLCQIKGQELGVLLDISKSLAMIADCCLDTWQKDQADRFISMTQENRKLYCDYVKLDETAVINRLKASMLRSKVKPEFQPKTEEPPVLDRCDQCIRKEGCNSGLRTREALKHDCPHFIQSEEERIAYWKIDGCLRKDDISHPGTSYLYAVHCSNCGYHTDFTTSRTGIGGPGICPQCSMRMEVDWIKSEEENDGE